MSTAAKDHGAPTSPGYRGVRIFTYPKTIFFLPTCITALICALGMLCIGDDTLDPQKRHELQIVQAATLGSAEHRAGATKAAPSGPRIETVKPGTAKTPAASEAAGTPAPRRALRFGSPQNFLAVAFLLVLGINLLIMSIDFPRFTVLALVLLFAALGFFILWLNVYFELLPPLIGALEAIYLAANAGFYFAVATVILLNFAIIWATRYLDFWEVLPNEILHNHGPFSDLERFPTQNLKFDKEIPDILEYALLRAGRLVLHVPGQQRSIVLDNVLWINTKEQELKKLLSRMEVRITTDQETAAEQL